VKSPRRVSSDVILPGVTHLNACSETSVPTTSTADDDGSIISGPAETGFATIAAAIREGDFQARELTPGQKIHHYRIERLLGQGGMSNVFEAEHVYLRQKVAIKTIRPQYANTATIADRFLREAQALALLNRTHVLRVLDASMFEDLPYVVTELLTDGADLGSYLREHGTLTFNQTMDLMEQVGEVLVHQESLGIFHRDIKPANIWVRHNGGFCVIDYGLVGYNSAVLQHNLGTGIETAVGGIMGTPMYMAPESFRGAEYFDNRSDLFGLGMTVFECLTGKRARESTISELMSGNVKPVPCVSEFRSDISAELKTIVRSLTASSPDERYSTASAFVHDLEMYRYGRQRPYGATRGTVFIALPFRRSFDALFEFLRDVCGEARLAARRVDRVTEMKEIWGQIDKEIQLSSAVIGVFTRPRWHFAPNPNVITEAAHARAIGKPLILMTTDPAERLPFDWRHLPIIRYRKSDAGMAALREELLPRLRQISTTNAGS
jgi:tRNA A-37 threonylcarbamoyl transferase component Bud32